MTVNKQTENNCTPQEIAKLIEEKLTNRLNLIQENVNLLTKTKLNEITASATPSNESPVSHGKNEIGENTIKDFRTIMLSTKNEKMVKEEDRKRG